MAKRTNTEPQNITQEIKDQIKRRTPLKHILMYIQSTVDDMVVESVRTQTTFD